MKIDIKICGERGSGKTTISSVIQKALREYGLDVTTQICENINTENLIVRLSRNDIDAIRRKD